MLLSLKWNSSKRHDRHRIFRAVLRSWKYILRRRDRINHLLNKFCLHQQNGLDCPMRIDGEIDLSNTVASISRASKSSMDKENHVLQQLVTTKAQNKSSSKHRVFHRIPTSDRDHQNKSDEFTAPKKYTYDHSQSKPPKHDLSMQLRTACKLAVIHDSIRILKRTLIIWKRVLQESKLKLSKVRFWFLETLAINF